MLATLRRIYLYLVASAALIFVVNALGTVLTALFYTLRLGTPAPYALPMGTTVDQSLRQGIVLLALAVLFVGPIGAVHYVFVVREGRRNPAALGGVVRTVFLDLLTIGFASFMLSNLRNAVSGVFTSDPYSQSYATVAVASALAQGLGLGLMLFERRRSTAPRVVARRVTLVLVGLAQFGWLVATLFALSQAVQSILDTTIAALPVCSGYASGPCLSSYNSIPSAVAAAAVVALGLAGFLYWLRRDRSSLIAQLTLGLLVLSSAIMFLQGIAGLAAIALRILTGERGAAWRPGIISVYEKTGFYAQPSVAPTVAGLVVLAAVLAWSGSWSRGARGTLVPRGRALTLVGLLVPLLGFLLFGASRLAGALLAARLTGQHTRLEAMESGGQVVAGLAWFAVWPVLGRLQATLAAQPAEWVARHVRNVRSAYVILVAGATLVGCIISLAIAAYTLLSAFAGSPVANGNDLGPHALGTGLVLGVAAAFHGLVWWRARERTALDSTPEAAPTASTPATLEEVLRQVAARELEVPAAAEVLRSRFGARDG